MCAPCPTSPGFWSSIVGSHCPHGSLATEPYLPGPGLPPGLFSGSILRCVYPVDILNADYILKRHY